MMKRKLIKAEQDILINCDNPKCSYKIENPTKDINEDISKYLNKPCPMCGDNLLNEKDYKNHSKVVKIINWINKWFSWLTVFNRNAEQDKKEVVGYTIDCRNGININKEHGK